MQRRKPERERAEERRREKEENPGWGRESESGRLGAYLRLVRRTEMVGEWPRPKAVTGGRRREETPLRVNWTRERCWKRIGTNLGGGGGEEEGEEERLARSANVPEAGPRDPTCSGGLSPRLVWFSASFGWA